MQDKQGIHKKYYATKEQRVENASQDIQLNKMERLFSLAFNKWSANDTQTNAIELQNYCMGLTQKSAHEPIQTAIDFFKEGGFWYGDKARKALEVSKDVRKFLNTANAWLNETMSYYSIPQRITYA